MDQANTETAQEEPAPSREERRARWVRRIRDVGNFAFGVAVALAGATIYVRHRRGV